MADLVTGLAVRLRNTLRRFDVQALRTAPLDYGTGVLVKVRIVYEPLQVATRRQLSIMLYGSSFDAEPPGWGLDA